MTLTTIFFDLDDTLYPSESGLWPAICQRIDLYLLERVGYPPDQITAVRSHFSEHYGTTLRGLRMTRQIDTQDYLSFVHDLPLEEYIQPSPMVRQTLTQISQRKLILTNSDRNHARRVLSILGVSDLFEQIIDINNLDPFCKPQPEAFQRALKLTGVMNAQECVFIDDSIGNLAAAKQLGFFTILIGDSNLKTGYNTRIKKFSDLVSALKGEGEKRKWYEFR